MKRMLTVVLSLVMLSNLLVLPAQAAKVKPTPPGWVEEAEYAVFPGDPVYEEENWKKVLQARANAEAGNPMPEKLSVLADNTPGSGYEEGMILLRYAASRPDRSGYAKARVKLQSIKSEQLKEESYENQRLVKLWYWRAMILEPYYRQPSEALGSALCSIERDWGITLDELLDSPLMDVVGQDERAMLRQAMANYLNRVELRIDQVQVLAKDVKLFIENGRTMAPIRFVAEYLGADVSWDAERNAARMVRAGTEILLPIGQKRAYVNGKEIPLDTTTYVKDGRTIVPVRYVAEFFGQSVQWNEELRSVMIEEDKQGAKGSNLEQWALPMGAMIPAVAYSAPTHFGRSRGAKVLVGDKGVPVAQSARKTLAESWQITDRASLISTVLSMTEIGHNAAFLELAQSDDADSYTAALYKKWGDKGILCWDLFRMSNLVQFGYEAGYVTYEEALVLLEPAAKRLQASFSSWRRAYENYLDGYGWWSGTGYAGQNVWETERGKLFELMIKNERIAPIFDDSLFREGVIGIQGLTADQVKASS